LHGPFRLSGGERSPIANGGAPADADRRDHPGSCDVRVSIGTARAKLGTRKGAFGRTGGRNLGGRVRKACRSRTDPRCLAASVGCRWRLTAGLAYAGPGPTPCAENIQPQPVVVPSSLLGTCSSRAPSGCISLAREQPPQLEGPWQLRRQSGWVSSVIDFRGPRNRLRRFGPAGRRFGLAVRRPGLAAAVRLADRPGPAVSPPPSARLCPPSGTNLGSHDPEASSVSDVEEARGESRDDVRSGIGLAKTGSRGAVALGGSKRHVRAELRTESVEAAPPVTGARSRNRRSENRVHHPPQASKSPPGPMWSGKIPRRARPRTCTGRDVSPRGPADRELVRGAMALSFRPSCGAPGGPRRKRGSSTTPPRSRARSAVVRRGDVGFEGGRRVAFASRLDPEPPRPGT